MSTDAQPGGEARAEPAAVAGYLALVLHAHLPFVRHPEHERFLEESWLFEAITETYSPLLALLEEWERDRLPVSLTIGLSPTLCAMLQDPLLRERYERRLARLIELAEKEAFRTHWDGALRPLAELYHRRFLLVRETWHACERDLVGAFRRLQDRGRIEIITCAATHGLLPLLAARPGSLRGQILTARDHYRACFGRDPRGIWLPECAYTPEIEPVLQAANLRWFVTDTHGLLWADPAPRYGVYAPIYTPHGLAAFGRDLDSAKQVWSREAGYPGDPRYRDFYRDIGFDLDFEYVGPCLPSPDHRGFTGIKYHRITGRDGAKAVYDREAALSVAGEHARHFLAARQGQMHGVRGPMDRPPVIVAPYDAELFGHWWYEGPEFLDALFRRAASDPRGLSLITPTEYLRRHPTSQAARPCPSSWGQAGYWRVWLNEKNEWIMPHLLVAGERMSELARRFAGADGLAGRALRQAGRELLLAQASDWPFILETGACPEYARERVTGHLRQFGGLYEQLVAGRVDPAGLARLEEQNNLFPQLETNYWA
jgi:1,4-alpha-glucan branching enzyme